MAWTASAQLQPWNNLFLIVIMIWLQTGYAMVLFSAAIKGIPAEILEAARVDGANEIQVFFGHHDPVHHGHHHHRLDDHHHLHPEDLRRCLGHDGRRSSARR